MNCHKLKCDYLKKNTILPQYQPIVQLKMRLRDEQSLFEAIEIFESQFASWLKTRLRQKGIDINESLSFPEMLREYENKLNGDRQHVTPLLNWIKEKDKCTILKLQFNDVNHHLDQSEFNLLEKTAMDGAVLLLTFQNN